MACNPTQTGFDLGECLTLDGTTPVKDVYDTPAVLVNLLVKNIFIVAGIIIFILIIFSGFKFIQGASKGKDEAKTIMTAAIGGLIVMFIAYWIVKIIEILIGQPILL